MLHPSYTDLMKVVNSEVEEGDEPVVSSRYSIVMATSKRARQLIAGDDALIENYEGRKPLSIAVEELNQGKIKILGDEDIEDEDMSDGDISGEDMSDEDMVNEDMAAEETEDTVMSEQDADADGQTDAE